MLFARWLIGPPRPVSAISTQGRQLWRSDRPRAAHLCRFQVIYALAVAWSAPLMPLLSPDAPQMPPVFPSCTANAASRLHLRHNRDNDEQQRSGQGRRAKFSCSRGMAAANIAQQRQIWLAICSRDAPAVIAARWWPLWTGRDARDPVRYWGRKQYAACGVWIVRDCGRCRRRWVRAG